MKLNGNNVYIKDYDVIKTKDILFALSDKTSKEESNYWTVPFYHTKEDKIYVIVWNNKDEDPIDVNFIINNDKIISFNNIKKYQWNVSPIGDINEINSILVLVNNQVKTHVILNDDNRDLFKQTNYSQHTI
jgi:hypothetical protein